MVCSWSGYWTTWALCVSILLNLKLLGQLLIERPPRLRFPKRGASTDKHCRRCLGSVSYNNVTKSVAREKLNSWIRTDQKTGEKEKTNQKITSEEEKGKERLRKECLTNIGDYEHMFQGMKGKVRNYTSKEDSEWDWVEQNISLWEKKIWKRVAIFGALHSYICLIFG